MDLEPQKFFIGLVDFFSIILPGALLTYFTQSDLGPWVLGPGHYGNLTGNAAIAAFLFSSYLLGHFIFLIGSWLLDDAYDRVRDATRDKQIGQLARGGGLSAAPFRWLASLCLKSDVDRAVAQAVQIKSHYLDPLGATSAVNAFQWAKARLTIETPAAMSGIQRFEADQKFFRSLVVVLAILIPWALLNRPVQPGTAIAGIPLLLLALWRYIDQRAKATNQAYWFLIAAEAAREGGYRRPKATDALPGALTHAGGVVYRHLNGREHEYLLVQATDDPNDWVLPKGHIKRDEDPDPACTAVREVNEETGVWAAARSLLDDVRFTTRKEEVYARYFLMEAVGASKPLDRDRRIEWLPMSVALSRTRHEEIRSLIRLADNRIGSSHKKKA